MAKPPTTVSELQELIVAVDSDPGVRLVFSTVLAALALPSCGDPTKAFEIADDFLRITKQRGVNAIKEVADKL